MSGHRLQGDIGEGSRLITKLVTTCLQTRFTFMHSFCDSTCWGVVGYRLGKLGRRASLDRGRNESSHQVDGSLQAEPRVMTCKELFVSFWRRRYGWDTGEGHWRGRVDDSSNESLSHPQPVFLLAVRSLLVPYSCPCPRHLTEQPSGQPR